MKLALQIALGILSLIPLYFSVTGVLAGAASLQDAPSAGIDNQFRYLSAIYLAITLLIWWVIPKVEQHATPVRIVACVMFLGGFARLYSHLTLGPGEPTQFTGMIIEFCAIIFIPWQYLVAKKYNQA